MSGFAAPADDGKQAGGSRSHGYATWLSWLFHGFSSIRVLTYLPTIGAVLAQGNSDQHSLWTWGVWAASNVTMALWLYERNSRRLNGAVVVTAANAGMSIATALVVALHRP